MRTLAKFIICIGANVALFAGFLLILYYTNLFGTVGKGQWIFGIGTGVLVGLFMFTRELNNPWALLGEAD
jgi:hypothetical protein